MPPPAATPGAGQGIASSSLPFSSTGQSALTRLTLAVAQFHLGKLDQARANLGEARALTPAAAVASDDDLGLVDAREGKLVRAQDRLRKDLANTEIDDASRRQQAQRLFSRLQQADWAQVTAKVDAIVDAADIARAAKTSPRPAQ